MNVRIMTDSCSDLPVKFIKENNIEVIPFVINIKGQDILDDLGETLKVKEFYSILREGEITSTACGNTFDYMESFKKYVEKGEAVIYICFSSALSGALNSANIAKETILEEYKDADITIIDSKSASLGLGLLVYYANTLLKEGYSKDEIIEWIENNKMKVNHWFTVDDLNHLKRGGRVSHTAATVGTVLQIKPIMHVDNDGRLIPLFKVKGRKKSIKSLAEKVKERIVDTEKQTIFISHGDCLEEAEHLQELVIKDNEALNVIINPIGPVVGTHSGPGTLAIFFIGNER